MVLRRDRRQKAGAAQLGYCPDALILAFLLFIK